MVMVLVVGQVVAKKTDTITVNFFMATDPPKEIGSTYVRSAWKEIYFAGCFL
jgi:hypothetical protein